jgi:rhamnosyl/mannosyltransferase
MEAMVQLICRHTSSVVQNRVIVANQQAASVEERDGSIEVVRLGALARVGAVAICPGFPLQLARETADIVVLHEPNPMAIVAYWLARPAGQLIVWFHSEVVRPNWRFRLFYRPFLQFVFRRAAKIVVSSPQLAKSSEPLREWQVKCVVIPFAVEKTGDADDLAIRRRADEIRSDAKGPLVLFVGRLVPYKGVSVLLSALQTIPASLVVVGEGPLRRALEQQAVAAGLAGRVRFAGEVDERELAALYHACDVFALPSTTRQETFGVVQLEAMTRGKPVVSTRLQTGVDWVNRDGETGLIVPPGDAGALAAAIERLLLNPAERRAMGQAGQARARTVFNVEDMANAILDLYRTVLGADDRRKTVA